MEVTLDTLVHPPSLAALRVAAAEHALVLACHHRAITDGLTARLREALPRHRIVAISLTSMSTDERDLIEQVLETGTVALVTIHNDRMAVRLTSWLEAEITLTLPGARHAA
jgi:hypothetical protein